MASDSRIVALETDLAGKSTTVNVVADKVREIAEFDTTTLQRAPPIGKRRRSALIAGIARWKDAFIVLPDMAKILKTEGI